MCLLLTPVSLDSDVDRGVRYEGWCRLTSRTETSVFIGSFLSSETIVHYSPGLTSKSPRIPTETPPPSLPKPTVTGGPCRFVRSRPSRLTSGGPSEPVGVPDLTPLVGSGSDDRKSITTSPQERERARGLSEGMRHIQNHHQNRFETAPILLFPSLLLSRHRVSRKG